MIAALAVGLGGSGAGCAATRAEIATTFKEGREAQRHLDEGKAKYEAGDYAGALPHFQRTLVLDPRYDAAEAHLAWSYYQLGRYPEATRHFRQAHPDWHGLHSGLGWTYLQLGDRAKARASFQRALQLKPDYADARTGLAHASR
jgi:Flp pilus assembly protein TadD